MKLRFYIAQFLLQLYLVIEIQNRVKINLYGVYVIRNDFVIFISQTHVKITGHKATRFVGEYHLNVQSLLLLLSNPILHVSLGI